MPWMPARALAGALPPAGRARLRLEPLESRDPGATAILTPAGTLNVQGTAANDHILIRLDGSALVVTDQTGEIGRFSSGRVAAITVNTGAGNDLVKIAANVTAPATINGDTGKNLLQAGGGPTTITGSEAASKLVGGLGSNVLVGGTGPEKITGGFGSNAVTAISGNDRVVRVKKDLDKVATAGGTRVLFNNPKATLDKVDAVLTAAEVGTLLRRAAAASASEDAIIAIVDRNGRILGVRTEAGVAPEITGSVTNLVFAIDGAVSLARTGAFFGNDQAPLTSRTIRSLSQSTITQREVESNPSVPDPNSTLRGPGFVAPVGIGGHFPPGVPNTPPVDLFGIEHTNRDGTFNPGLDEVLGTGDDILLPNRFNVNPAFTGGQMLFPPDSYGFITKQLGPAPAGMPQRDPNRVFQGRGVATLPGGIPIYRAGTLAGGIGVFFPGKTGYATEENSSLGSTFDPTKPDRSLEAEYIAFAAAGGSSGAHRNFGTINGVPLPPGFDLPFGRIDLVGITLDVFGPGGNEGIRRLMDFGRLLGVGNPDSGVNRPVTPGGATLLAGLPVPFGWLVNPHAGVGITADEVTQIIQRGILQAERTRAAIRLPLSSPTRMVLAVADRNGEVVGLYRMPDATIFSEDVAVAKARNVNYYADSAKLNAADQVPSIAPGVAFTNRTFRYLALPRFPSGATEGTAPGPFSIVRDGGADPFAGRQVGPRKPASDYQSVYGHDSFFPGTNFHDKTNLANRNGIVFFPGSAPLYRTARGLIGGFGVSGDGVDQDDVVTASGASEFVPGVALVPRADQVQLAGVRLPYQKFDRNPEGL